MSVHLRNLGLEDRASKDEHEIIQKASYEHFQQHIHRVRDEAP